MTSDPRDTERDPDLGPLYRQLGREEPSPALDEAVLAAARRAVAGGPRRLPAAFSGRWPAAVSIAAVLVVSVGLVTMLQRQGEAPRINAPEADSPLGMGELRLKSEALRKEAPERDAAPGVAASSARRADTAADEAGPPAQDQLGARGYRPQAQIAPRAEEAERTPAAAPAEPRGREMARPAPEAAAAPAAVPDWEQMSPQDWIRRIEELLATGHVLEAEEALRLFRERHPDHPLPGHLYPLGPERRR